MRVKVCCISSQTEAALAVAHGAHALGLVGEMPSGPGPIPDELIAEIAASVPPGVSRFLLTSRTDGDAIADHAARAGVDTVQIVDDRVTAAERRRVGRALPALRIVQVVHVEDESAIDTALSAQEGSHAVLLDSGRPNAPVRELGGTGRAHDWGVSRRIVESLDVPVFLAGGLNPSNAAEAYRAVRPYALDLCSGVRTDGKLDETKLAAFFAAVAGV